MNDFSHVPDEGVRNYLQDPVASKDYNLMAAQLSFAEKHLANLTADKVEMAAYYLSTAEEAFMCRMPSIVQSSLRHFWGHVCN
jgi:hypothetical protein